MIWNTLLGGLEKGWGQISPVHNDAFNTGDNTGIDSYGKHLRRLLGGQHAVHWRCQV